MKTRITLMILFLASTYSFAQNNDIENIRAAILSPHNNKAYFFVGKNKVYQYNPAIKKREWIRTLGTNTFRGFSNASNVDAAFIMPGTTKAFLFRGNKWYRYNMKEGKLEREGILGQDGYKGILGPVDGAVPHGRSGNIAFFKGKRIFLYSPKAGKVIYTGTIGANNVYKGVPFNIDGVIQWTNGMAYFFKGDHYYRYNFDKLRVDIPTRIIGKLGFKNLFPSIDAALPGAAFRENYYWEDTSKKDWFGAIGSAIAQTLSGINNSGNKKKTSFGTKHFEGVPHNLDAAFICGHSKKKVFLKGRTWYRYNGSERRVERTGEITKTWKGVPADVDAATSITGEDYHYFFKNDKFWRWNYKTKRVDKSGSIRSEFNGVPDYLDAAIYIQKHGDIYFYKKTTEYVYDIGQRKVVEKYSIAKIAK